MISKDYGSIGRLDQAALDVHFRSVNHKIGYLCHVHVGDKDSDVRHRIPPQNPADQALPEFPVPRPVLATKTTRGDGSLPVDKRGRAQVGVHRIRFNLLLSIAHF